MARILGITALNNHGHLNHWWQIVLVVIIAASVAVGLLTILWTIINAIRAYFKRRSQTPTLPRAITQWLQDLKITHFPAPRPSPPRPSSFGVYLGAISTPPTQDQVRVLSQWEAIIVNTSKAGVATALGDNSIHRPQQVINRLDFQDCFDTSIEEHNELELAHDVGVISNRLNDIFKITDSCDSLTGILLAGWRDRLPVAMLDLVAKSISSHNLEVYLEIEPPNFLEGDEFPNLSLFSGVVVRNATILPNGELRDFFQMDNMKSTTKAFVSEACRRSFLVMMMETIDDDVHLSHAVLRRCYMWCGYHGAIPWIGRQASITDASESRHYAEPLAAFQWLKDRKVMAAHEAFRNTNKLDTATTTELTSYRSLTSLFPGLQRITDFLKFTNTASDLGSRHSSSTVTLQDTDMDQNSDLEIYESPKLQPEWTKGMSTCTTNPLSSSASGTSYDYLGCFPIGLDATPNDHDAILESQRRLRKLRLLNPISASQLDSAITSYVELAGSDSMLIDLNITIREAILDLVDRLPRSSVESPERHIEVYIGLDSGFRTTSGAQFWAVYDSDPSSDATSIYIAKSAQDITSVLLHAYLSNRGFTRYQCFQAEQALHQLQANPDDIGKAPCRFRHDLALLSPTDLLLFLQHISFSKADDASDLLSIIEYCCRDILVNAPSYAQMKRICNSDYLGGACNAEAVVAARLEWYHQMRCRTIGKWTATQIFQEIDTEFVKLLKDRDYDSLDRITTDLAHLVDDSALDWCADFVVFCVISAAKRYAFEEVYIEVQDRNPLFNLFPDQSAAFAELFALGSRCESYFGVSPSEFGVLLSARHRTYYQKSENQPPLWIWNAPSFASAYAAAQTDIDPKTKASVMPAYRRFTFLSVFAIPALIDIMLLTTTGRGLYLSAFMTLEEQKYATLALMISLLLSGAIGTWISIGGTYYLVSMAFSAANMFVLTRLLGGLAFTIAGAFLGFIIISATHNAHAGAVFFFYLIGLTFYLSVLAVLSTYQIPGSTFLNGRAIILWLVPILAISPIVTTWVPGYDVIIYLATLHVFVFGLLLGSRHIGSKWVTWYNSIKILDDKDVKAWYTSSVGVRPSEKMPIKSNRLSKANAMTQLQELQPEETLPEAFDGLTEPAVLALCRDALCAAVTKERNRHFWQKHTANQLVKDLASSWDSTIFLLDWYCRTSDVKRPIPYSSTWNLETQVALDMMQQAQKGIRLHNSFIHWRNAGDEVGCGILYFLVALLDRWVELLNGGQLVGLSAALNKTFRLSVGFGLAYYLIGAVLLDYKAQHLHQVSEQHSPTTIKDKSQIREAKLYDDGVRRRLYWNTLGRFLGVHVWALSLSAALIFVFNGSPAAMVMFLSYVGSYSGLLLYQYNKIFSGPHALLPLSAACIIGFPVGFTLKAVNPTFEYNSVIALGTATWTAAILSIRTAKLGPPDFLVKLFGCLRRAPSTKKSSESHSVAKSPNTTSFHAYCDVGFDSEWSQNELEALYTTLRHGPKESRFEIRPFNHPAVEIKASLLACSSQSLSPVALDAFPTAPYMVQNIVSTWENGRIDVYIVSRSRALRAKADVRAIVYKDGVHLTLLVVSDGVDRASQPDIRSNCQLIAETLLRACSEILFNVHPLQAEFAKSLMVCKNVDTRLEFTISEHTKRAFSSALTENEVDALIASTRRQLLASLCLGLDCDAQWEALPSSIRKVLLQRCLGAAQPTSSSDLEWIQANVHGETSCDVNTKLARYDFGAFLTVQQLNFLQNLLQLGFSKDYYVENPADIQDTRSPGAIMRTIPIMKKLAGWIQRPIASLYHQLGTVIKFFVLSGMADPEYQRELVNTLDHAPRFVRGVARFLLTGLWIYNRVVQSLILPLFIYHGRRDVKQMATTIRGSIITQKKNRIVVEKYDSETTAFLHMEGAEGFDLYFYPGILKEEPKKGQTIVTTFGHDMKLYSRKEFVQGAASNEYVYDYNSRAPRRQSRLLLKWDNPRIPLAKTCINGPDSGAVYRYNYKGHIDSGSYLLNGNLVRFQYHYRKNAKFDDELLRAEFVLPHISVDVSWCAPPVRHAKKLERWIPTPRVYQATFVQDSNVYECSWLYDHKFHPTITTKLNGELIETPDMIRNDWLGVLKKPKHCSFADENPLLGFRSPSCTFISRILRTNIKSQPVSTARARSHLWKAWKKRKDLDGVVTRWVDEQLLRGEPLLRKYWWRRDRGSLTKAEDYLALHADAIMANSDLSSDISAWTPLAIRMSDLFSFGQGGDAVVYTRTKALQKDTDSSLHVIAVDTGTWPNEGGGVSACRRDLINNLRTVKWHMVVESANDFGLPKHQTEENVESLKIIPLWGLDFMHPCHGMFSNKLDSDVDHLFHDATVEDIRTNFLPTLTALVQGARAINMTQAHVKQATRALVNLNSYFQDSRHWKEVWTSDLVKDTWRELWLADDMPNTQAPSEWFTTELPTLGHLDTALELWFRYLFIFSIPIPENIPAVFQASHHSVSASYGIVCKIKRNCTLQIWDHAISWRETNLYLSSAMCTLPPFIRNSLLGLMRLTSTLILHHADQILPCADFFNPGWEVEIGTSQGTLTHRNVFRRKVDPIVNGITDMAKFAPVSEIKTKKPTVTMLSHVWFAKDIKTALLAADIISNEWGFKDYKLDIYGALNKAPVYSSECQEILACKGLSESVSLRGTADPAMVLENTWLFLNSSVSEGLPLALGEAALTGAPVVCTDVGASLRVLTDPETGARYSEVVAPNDAYGLARAQINLLAMIDDWAQYANDDPSHLAPILPHKPTPADVEILTRRMYEKSDQRRKLGMMARDIVQKSFSGERYLREHEQMLWIGKSVSEMRKGNTKARESQSVSLMRQGQGNNSSGAQTPDLDPMTQRMRHPLRTLHFRHFSNATSFSSVYIDEPGPSVERNDWGILTPGGSDEEMEVGGGVGVAVARPAQARLSTRKPPLAYENGKGKEKLRMNEEWVDGEKRLSRFRGTGSERSSVMVRSSLCEVQNANEE